MIACVSLLEKPCYVGHYDVTSFVYLVAIVMFDHTMSVEHFQPLIVTSSKCRVGFWNVNCNSLKYNHEHWTPEYILKAYKLPIFPGKFCCSSGLMDTFQSKSYFFHKFICVWVELSWTWCVCSSSYCQAEEKQDLTKKKVGPIHLYSSNVNLMLSSYFSRLYELK